MTPARCLKRRLPMRVAVVVLVLVIADAATWAQPPPVPSDTFTTPERKERAAGLIARRTRAVELAAMAYSAEHCNVVTQLEPQIRQLDADYHGRVFVRSQRVLTCMPWLVPPPRKRFERNGPFVRAGFDLLLIFPQVEAQLGWTFRSRVSVYASAAAGIVILGEPLVYGGAGAGARLWIDRTYLDARVGRLFWRPTCDFDDPCEVQGATLGYLGVGKELAQTPHVGVDLHGQVFVGADVIGALFGFAMSFYL
jgi:hypothetical protein